MPETIYRDVDWFLQGERKSGFHLPPFPDNLRPAPCPKKLKALHPIPNDCALTQPVAAKLSPETKVHAAVVADPEATVEKIMIPKPFFSGVAGAFIPLALKRLGADPATASSFFVTTATDIGSMGLFLFLAAHFASQENLQSLLL